ncbi:uncharacterized protein LOC128960084 [Oppia nitens]|uniref:uncharacterized protein LOC128960084 n=1 Tax=Oppia nitens TaxID=1686743 RepID=UPI0023DBFA14|nr:uncharacterized protein LOC128960084 [Oppia nitens]
MLYTTFAPNWFYTKYMFITNISASGSANRAFTTLETTGFTVASIVSFSYQFINRQLVSATFYTLFTVSCLLILLSNNEVLLYVLSVLIGHGSAIYYSTVTVIVVEMWRRNTNQRLPVLQILQLCLSVGYLLSRHGVQPFLNELMFSSDTSDDQLLLSLQYLLYGTCILSAPVLMFVVYCLQPDSKVLSYSIVGYPSDQSQAAPGDHSTTTTTTGKQFNTNSGRKIRLLFAALYVSYITFESMTTKYGFVYLIFSPIGITEDESSTIYTVSSVIYTLGLVLNIAYPYRFTTKSIITSHFAIIIIGAVLQVPARHSLACVWLATLVKSLGFSAMTSSILTYIDDHLNLTDRLLALFLFARGLVSLIAPVVVEFIVEIHSVMFVITELSLLFLSVVLFLVISSSLIDKTDYYNSKQQQYYILLLSERFNRQLWVSLSFILLTIFSATIPLTTQVVTLYICAAMIGLCSGIFVTYIYVWGIELWTDSRLPIVQILELCFGVGSIFSTILLRPTKSPVYWRTFLIGVPITMTVLYFLKPYKKSYNINKTLNGLFNEETPVDSKLFDRPNSQQKIVCHLFALLFALYMVNETIFMKFAVNYYQRSPLKLNGGEAQDIYSVSIVLYTLGVAINIGLPYL